MAVSMTLIVLVKIRALREDVAQQIDAHPRKEPARMPRKHGFFCVIGLLFFLAAGCSSTSTTTFSRGQTDQPRGFWQKMVDQITERQCNVGRFICPYGMGPAGEPCECTDPAGYLLKGRTVK